MHSNNICPKPLRTNARKATVMKDVDRGTSPRSPGRVTSSPMWTRVDTTHEHIQPKGQADSVGKVAAWQTADLAELKDWVEGLRAAAHNAREAGNITLAQALDITRFEVYESYLDEEHTNNRAKRLMIKN
jgi:hypothetical protein